MPASQVMDAAVVALLGHGEGSKGRAGAGKERSATGIISPMSGKVLGSCIHDVDLVEGGCSKAVTDPSLLR